MATKVLYKNFLNNKRVYNLAQASWGRLLNSLLKDFGYTHTPYLNNLVNGKKEYDGNPIFNAYIPEIKRAIRIIQVSPQEEGDDISAWIDDIELKQKSRTKKTKELVLDIKLSAKARNIATEIIKEWIQKQVDATYIDNLLESKLN
jgi:hypothetical protein